ncbi:BTAD domain-containing putative transcriptional regulator [Amycolatopsis pigmentata]|uniref:BTAD domain-containing putative transcriptional regulator n=1 Tax=Amycolatopsis pigmentata TaxID=450801 RepID=A0ABW5FK94_9PSEU
MTTHSPRPRQKASRPPSMHRRASWVLVGILRLLGRVLQGLIAAAMLLALIGGLPWALWHYIGWPLPHHVPTLAELQGVLLGPMTTTFLLDFLACLCWITWAVFTLDVVGCAAEVVRGVRLSDLPTAGAVHGLAAVLVGAVVLSVLGNRTASDSAPIRSTALPAASEVVATAPAWNHVYPGVRNAAFTEQTTGGSATIANPPLHPTSVVVHAPENGVHDSLWRIAQRMLGDGARWPEIFELNKGKPQPGHRPLTLPSLIFPGQELLLPADATLPPPTPPPAPPTTAPPSSTQRPPVPSTQPAPPDQTPPASDAGARQPATRELGVRWGPELFVGLGLAAAVTAALTIARRRYYSRYRPGSGDRTDYPMAPVVYQLRMAHARAEWDDEDDHGQEHVPSPPTLVVGSSERQAPSPVLGVRDGREIALELASARGLGLVGPGAPAALRALLLATLTGTAPANGTTVVVPVEDLAVLLGHLVTRAQLPAALRVVDTLGEALDALEAEILVRAVARREQDITPESSPPLVLVARPQEHQQQRLQAVLDDGAPFGVTGLLLGQWRPGISAYVREDGTISATSPGPGEALRKTEMFRLGDDDTVELLTLLHDADRHTVRQPLTQPGTASGMAQTKIRRPLMLADAEPAKTDQAGGTAVGPDTELEITAAVETPVDDTALEILGPQLAPIPRLRARPPVHDAGRPEASAVASDHKTVVVDTAATERAEAAPHSRPTRAPVRLSVLGPPRMFWRPEPEAGDSETTEREITTVFQPRSLELLVFLAVHPDGVNRDTLVGTLWADTPSGKTTNALNTALSRLRAATSKATNGTLSNLTITGGGRYRLDPELVEVDYWHFEAAVTARRAAPTVQQRVDAYRRVVDRYGGPLADGLSSNWIETAREAIRRDGIDAVAALARALVDDDPQQTLDLLEAARAFDPHNEALYRDIMRLQERLGQIDAIPRTLTLLRRRLSEIDAKPSAEATTLAARLHHRHTHDAGASHRRTVAGR